MDDWSRRLFATLAMVGAAHALQFIPLPWLQLAEWGTPAAFGGWLIVSRESSPLSVAALGLVPFTSGLGLTAVVFAVVPRLNRSLEQPGGETRLLRVGLYVSVLLAIVQSTGVGLFLHHVSLDAAVQEQNPWLVGSTVALFATLFAATPFALQRWGLGRGLSAAVLLYCLLKLAASLHAIGFDWLVANAGEVHGWDLGLLLMLVLATAGATRRWVGDVKLLPGDPRLDQIGRGLSIALIGFVALNAFGLEKVIRWASLGTFGEHVLELCVAVGGGLLLANRRSASDLERIEGSQLLALGTFVLFAASAVALLTDDRLAMPWAECVIATILIYMTWRESRTQGPMVAGDGAAQPSAGSSG